MQNNSDQTITTGFIKKRSVRVLLAVILFSLFFLAMVPLAVKLYLQYWLTQNGADSARIESLRFNPFTATLQVRGVDVSSGGKSLISDSSMTVDIGLSALFDRDIRVERAEYRDLSISLEQFADGGWRIGSVTLGNSGEPEEAGAVTEASPSKWNLLADHLLLANCEVDLKTPELDLRLKIKSAELKKFTTHRDKAAADITIDAELNGQPVYIALRGLQVNPDLSFEGEVRVTGFQLENLGKLLVGALPVFSGVAGVDGRLSFRMGNADGLSLHYDGGLSLQEARVGQDGFTTATDSLTFKGNVQFSRHETKPLTVQVDGLLSARAYSLDLPGADFSTSEARIELTGKTGVSVGTDISVSHEGSLLVENILTRVAGTSIDEQKLEVKDSKVFFSMGQDIGTVIDYDGEVTLDRAGLELTDGGGGFEGLSWLGTAHVTQQEAGPMKVGTEGTLTGRGLDLRLSGPGFSTAETLVELSGKTSVVLDSDVAVGHEGSLLVEGMRTTVSGTVIKEDMLSVKDADLAFRMGQDSGLSVDYEGEVVLDRGELELTAGVAGFDGVTWRGAVRVSDSQTSPMTVRTEGTLTGSGFELTLDGPGFSTTEKLVELSGTTDVVLDSGISVSHEGELNMEQVQAGIAESTINETKLNWKGAVRYDSKHEGGGFFVETDGQLISDMLSYENQDPSGPSSGGLAGLSWKGVIRTGEKQEQLQYLDIAGTLSGEDLRADLDGPELQLSQEKLRLEADLGLELSEKINMEGDASLDLDNFTLLAGSEPDPLVSLNSLQLTDVLAKQGGKITAANLRTAGLISNLPGDMPLRIEVDGIEVKDIVLEELARLNSALLEVDNTRVNSAVNGKELASLKQLQMNNIEFGGRPLVSVETTEFVELQALYKDLESTERALSLGHGTLAQLSWDSETGTEADRLVLEELQSAIVRDAKGVFTLVSQLDAMKRQKNEADSATGGGDSPAADADVTGTGDTGREAAGVPLKLKEFVLTGKNNIDFEDHSLAVPFITALTQAEMTVAGVDTTRHDSQLQLNFTGELENRAPLELSGTISPFRKKTGLDLKLALKNYPLTRLSPYTVQSIGTALAGGQLRVASDIKLAEDNLDMKNEIVLRKLETRTISPELAAQLNNELPVPLDSALVLLRDSKDDITLSIPFSGPVDDLSVGISDILVTALSKAILPAASGYLMYTLGPYGALAYVGVKVGEKMLEVRVPPVEFAPQQAEITETHRDYLERIAKILGDWPKKDVQICPRVSLWEFAPQGETVAAAGEKPKEVPGVDEEQLLQLGQRRGEAIRDYLVDKHGLDRTRLLICDTRIEQEKDSVPRVLLQL